MGDNMKIKTLVLAVLALGLAFFPVSCKKEVDLFWISGGTGNVAYDISADTTTLLIRCYTASKDDADAEVTAWRIVFRSGKTELLEVSGGNYQDFAPFLWVTPIAGWGMGSFMWQSNNPRNLADSHPYQGKLFPAAAPDNLNIFMTVADTTGTVVDIEQNLLVYYSNVE
jgi:hypothetical protein